MLEDTNRISDTLGEHSEHSAPVFRDTAAQSVDRRPASGWNFLAWSFFLAQMLNSSAALAAFEQFAKSFDPEIGNDAPAKAAAGSAAGEGIRAGTVPAGEESPSNVEAGDAAQASGVALAEVGGVDVSQPVEAGQVAALGEGAIAGGGAGQGSKTAFDGPVQVIGVIIDVPGGGTTGSGENYGGVDVTIDPGVGLVVDIDVDVDVEGSGVSVDAGAGGLADVVLDVDVSDGIATYLDVSVLDVINAELVIGLSDGIEIGLDAGLGGLADVALDLGLDQGLSTDIDLSLLGIADSQIALDLSNGLSGGLEASVGDIAGVVLDFSTANGLELDNSVNLGGIADVAIEIGSPLSVNADLSIASIANVELAFGLDGAVQDTLSPVTELLAEAAGPLLSDNIVTEALANIGVAPDLGITLTELSPMSLAEDLSAPLGEMAGDGQILDLLNESVPSLMSSAGEPLQGLSLVDAEILGLELPLGSFESAFDSGQPTDVLEVASDVEAALLESLDLTGALPMPVSSTIELISTGSQVPSSPLEIISGGSYTDYGINLQSDTAASESPLLPEPKETDQGGLLSSIDTILALDDVGSVDELDHPAFLPDIGGDDGALKGLTSWLL